MKISVLGVGCVGQAMVDSFLAKKMKLNNSLFVYDKYKKIGNIQDCLITDIVFLCLPTPYDNKNKKYNKLQIYNTCKYLSKNKFKGTVVIKSTVEPETTEKLSNKYPNLSFVHNPEFLSAKTAFKDFHYQKHIVIGKTYNLKKHKLNQIKKFYRQLYPKAKISVCSSTESESMKIFCNCFYAVKIQFFTELYLLCGAIGISFDNVVSLMIKNGWINPNHTKVPGTDGRISYGGKCFPKDTNALNQYMIKKGVLNQILNSVVSERKKIRKD